MPRENQSHKSRIAIPLLIAVATLGLLIITANPAQVGTAMGKVNLAFIPLFMAVSLGFYVLQGVRWWTLLRAAGFPVTLRKTVLMTITGQATALLPFGELTRAVLLARTADIGLGGVIATEAVQEILFVGLLFITALPASMNYRASQIAIPLAIVAIVALAAALTVPKIYHLLRNILKHVPFLRSILPGLDELHQYTIYLYTHRNTYVWLWISAVQAALAISLLWLVLLAVHPPGLAWSVVALVYAATQGITWISLSPGGLGASELSIAGFLVALGIPYSSATATAIIFRLSDKGLSSIVGFISYFAIVRRRYHLQGFNILKSQSKNRRHVAHTGVRLPSP